MNQVPRSSKLIQGVALRMSLIWLARRFFVAFLALSVVYAVTLLVSRLTGLIPNWFAPATLAFIPAGAAVIALLIPRRPTPVDAARRVDQAQGTKDLFLTLVLLETAAGDYQSLVARDAETRAGAIEPARIVPFHWERHTGWIAAIMLLAAAGVFGLPVLDPFGKVAQAEQSVLQEKALAASRKATEERKAELEERQLDEENSEEIDKALEKLVADFHATRPGEPKSNRQMLVAQQKMFGAKWQKLGNGKLKDLLNSERMDQAFGNHEDMLTKDWQKELQQGMSDKLEQELDELQEELEKLAKAKDPLERTEQLRKVQKRLDRLADFAGEQIGSKSLEAALKRASEQLEAMNSEKSEKITKEALAALKESLEVAKMEAQELAQSSRDLKSLEEALKLISMAKKVNEEGELDGEEAAEAKTVGELMAQYQEMYQQLMADGQGDGEGLGGQGFGEGGEAPEDESAKTDFIEEKSKTHLQKGKILLSMKTKGLSDEGEAEINFQSVVRDLRQSIDSAIEQEQIPPGYRDGIKKYFDTLEEPSAGADAAATDGPPATVPAESNAN